MALILFCLFGGLVLGLAAREILELVRWFRLGHHVSPGRPFQLTTGGHDNIRKHLS